MNETNYFANRPVEAQLKALRARKLPDIGRVCLKITPDETIPSQIKRHCLRLQGALFMLSVYSDFERHLSDELLEAYFMATSDLVYAISHLNGTR